MHLDSSDLEVEIMFRIILMERARKRELYSDKPTKFLQNYWQSATLVFARKIQNFSFSSFVSEIFLQ